MFHFKAITALLALCCAVSSASAATTNFELVVTFDAEKTRHDCISYFNAGAGPVSQGDCGPYTGLLPGEIYAGKINLVGQASSADGQVYELTSVSSATCSLGGGACAGHQSGTAPFACPFGTARYSQSALSLDALAYDASATFVFDFTTGSGSHTWEDGVIPLFSVGVFDLRVTGVRATGALPQPPGIPTPVPLPAGLPLLGVGLAVLGLVARRRRG